MKYVTVTGCALGFDSDTVNVSGAEPLFPSEIVGLSIDTAGTPSSFVIVPTPWSSPSVPPAAADRFTTSVSSGSNVVSPVAFTVTVWLVWPGANVTVPLAAV
jgi:hypothetical protein